MPARCGQRPAPPAGSISRPPAVSAREPNAPRQPTLRRAAFDDRRVLREQLEHAASFVERRRDEHERRLRLGLLESASSWSSARDAASLSRFGASSVSACATMTTRRGAIIGSVRTAATSDATPSASLSPVVMSPA